MVIYYKAQENVKKISFYIVLSVFLFIGAFFAFLPHSIHLFFGMPLPHPIHNLIGIIFLIAGSFFGFHFFRGYSYNWKSILFKALTFASVGLFIDFLVHSTISSPYETWFYFDLKWILLFITGILLFKSEIVKLRKIVIYSALFSLFWGIYYRGFELLNFIAIGDRAPIVLGINNLIFLAVFWSSVHFLSPFISGLLTKKL